ncbi:MAG TPA: BamA/TamA family outer membrane protein [Myxococcales bacterium]|nr:BamA/TamA family outer membrane protein [Myxococcales bacterium]
MPVRLASLAALLFAPAAAAQVCGSGLSTRLVPLPVYATLPNEGSTFGFMPVFLRVCDESKRTESIIAPSITYNDVIQWTGSFRWFYFPTDEQTLTLVGTLSTRINSGILAIWQDLPTANGRSTTEVTARFQRSVFYRFFGIGPDTDVEDESSYTRVRALLEARRGINLGAFNLGLSAFIRRDLVQPLGVPGLPLSTEAFPGTPGMEGSTTAGQSIDARYDTRAHGEYSDRGVYAQVLAGVVEGISNSPAYVQGHVDVRALWPELTRVGGAARAFWSAVSSGNAPFYDQSTLGGSFFMRGFTEDRFIDRAAWTVELEQRVRVLQTHIYGVVADWRMDVFVGAGQVYGSGQGVLSNPKFTGGVGFRAFVHPNVVGRVDVATGGEGVKVYVELGYPY